MADRISFVRTSILSCENGTSSYETEEQVERKEVNLDRVVVNDSVSTAVNLSGDAFDKDLEKLRERERTKDGPVSLFSQLQNNKAKLQAEMKEAQESRDLPKPLDDDEVDFLEGQRKKTNDIEQERRREESDQVAAFKDAVKVHRAAGGVPLESAKVSDDEGDVCDTVRVIIKKRKKRKKSKSGSSKRVKESVEC